MGEKNSSYFEFFFVTFKLYGHREFYGNTQTTETKQETLYFFFIISRKFNSGNTIKSWPFRILREWILPESQALEVPEGKLP